MRSAGRVLRRPGVLALLAALAGSFVIYYPALTAPFYGDDYVYRWAVRSQSTWDYVTASLEPLSRDAHLLFTGNFYRPLYFLSFPVLDGAFGDRTLGYHLVLLGSHLAAVVLVWLLALRLTGRALVAGVAAIAFSLHPSAIEAVAWISSLNSAALPLMLGAWLVFIAAVRTPAGPRRVALLVATGLLAAASLGFRETAVGLIPAIGAWYLVAEKRTEIFNWRTYPALLPFVAVVAVFYVLRTRFFTEPYADPFVYHWGSQVPGNLGYMLRQGAMPIDTTAGGWATLLGVAAATLILATLAVSLATRRWLLTALLIGMLFAILPYGPFTLPLGPRYFYFAAAPQALAIGVAVAEVAPLLQRREWPRRAPIALAGMAALGFVFFVADGNGAVRAFNQFHPEVQQAFVDGLRETHPELPQGGTLYVVDRPEILALFDAYVIHTTVRFYYPEVGEIVIVASSETEAEPALGPDDRVFISP